MLAVRILSVLLAASALDPCSGGAADSGASSEAAASTVDAAGAPVIDDVTLPATATIDLTRGSAHIVGAISFHSDDSTVVGVNVLSHGTSGTVYRGSLGAGSPQPLTFDLAAPGNYALDFNVFDAKNRYSAIVTRTIVVSE
jgi:hypothetical protein